MYLIIYSRTQASIKRRAMHVLAHGTHLEGSPPPRAGDHVPTGSPCSQRAVFLDVGLQAQHPNL